MPASFKAGMDESINDFARLLGCNLFAREAKHVCVVMLPCQRGSFFVRNERGTNPRNFVGHDAHADAGGTNQNAKIGLMLGHGMGNRQRMIRIIAGFPTSRPIDRLSSTSAGAYSSTSGIRACTTSGRRTLAK